MHKTPKCAAYKLKVTKPYPPRLLLITLNKVVYQLFNLWMNTKNEYKV